MNHPRLIFPPVFFPFSSLYSQPYFYYNFMLCLRLCSSYFITVCPVSLSRPFIFWTSQPQCERQIIPLVFLFFLCWLTDLEKDKALKHDKWSRWTTLGTYLYWNSFAERWFCPYWCRVFLLLCYTKNWAVAVSQSNELTENWKYRAIAVDWAYFALLNTHTKAFLLLR